MNTRKDLLREGIAESVIADVETVFEIGEFAHLVNWVEYDIPTLRLACPRCGSEADCHLDAVTDFFCPDDQDCGYDYGDSNESTKPLLA